MKYIKLTIHLLRLRALLLLLLSCFLLPTMAQELMVKSFVPTTDAIARTRNKMGTDGKVCAAVVVRIPVTDATFNGEYIIGKPEYKDGEYILDMQHGAAQMRVSVPGLNTIDVKFREYLNGSTLQSKTTYLLTITVPQIKESASEIKTQTLTIKVTPADAVVLIDDEMIEESSMKLSVGSHKYNVAAKGYESQSGTIDVPENRPAKLVVELDRKATSPDNTQPDVQQSLPDVFSAIQTQSNTQVATSTQSSQSHIEGNSRSFSVGDVTFTMKLVEAGTFKMGLKSSDGDGKLVHNVALSKDYYMGETEVTQALWKAVMDCNPSRFKDDEKPVERVSWEDCQDFVSKLNKLTGENFRLPNEAEWEYAAKGGGKSKNYTFSGGNKIGDVAHYTGNSSNTHPVKTKNANELGIYDMSGNVWEWCADWYGEYNTSDQVDPTGAPEGSRRVIRGGSWNNTATNCRPHNRDKESPSARNYYLGFRLALSKK